MALLKFYVPPIFQASICSSWDHGCLTFLCEDMDIEREVLSRIHDFNPEQVSVNWVFLESDCFELGRILIPQLFQIPFWQDSLDNFEMGPKTI